MRLESAIDLSNFLQVNVNAIHVYGLKAAVYLSELARLYNKALKKNAAVNGYMTIDREYVKDRTGLSPEEQYSADSGLSKAGISSWSPKDPDKVRFDFKAYLASISTEDVEAIASISRKMASAPKSGDSQRIRDMKQVESLKGLANTGNAVLDASVRKWVEEVHAVDKRLTASTVEDFQKTVMDYAKADLRKAQRVIEIATAQKWTNALSAIDAYSRENKAIRRGMNPLNVSDGVSKRKF